MEDIKTEQIDLSNVVLQKYKGSGPGGQRKNKVETAVRLTHPSGLVVCSESERFFKANKEKAFKELERRLLEQENNKAQQTQNLNRQDQIGKGYRGEKIRTIQVENNQVINHLNNKKCTYKDYLKGNLEKLF